MWTGRRSELSESSSDRLDHLPAMQLPDRFEPLPWSGPGCAPGSHWKALRGPPTNLSCACWTRSAFELLTLPETIESRPFLTRRYRSSLVLRPRYCSTTRHSSNPIYIDPLVVKGRRRRKRNKGTTYAHSAWMWRASRKVCSSTCSNVWFEAIYAQSDKAEEDSLVSNDEKITEETIKKQWNYSIPLDMPVRWSSTYTKLKEAMEQVTLSHLGFENGAGKNECFLNFRLEQWY